MPKIRAIVFDCYSTLIDIRTDENKEEVFHYLSLYLQYYGVKTDAEELRTTLDLEKKQYFQSATEAYPEIDLEMVFTNILRKEGLNNPFLAESCCRLLRTLSRERFQLFTDSLADGGFLCLGSKESIRFVDCSSEFDDFVPTEKIYRKR